MIITKLNGGLGNQLFEYACARSLQLTYGDEMRLDIEGFKRSPRHYALNNFVLSDEVSVLPERDSKSLILLQAISKISRNLAFWLGPLFGAYIWKSSSYRPLRIKNTKGRTLYLYGYWQSEAYFKEHKDQILKELKVKTPIPAECAGLLKEIERPNSVCVHVRRGDYVDCGFLHCDEAYFNRGLDFIRKKHGDCHAIVFSDEIEWVKKNMKFQVPVTFMDIDVPNYENLRLMYMCKHFVMSNSSYSWWAQYLSDNPEKIVVAPEYWLPEHKENRSLYLDNWIIL